jgi:PST family polysaccharide transporter
MPARSTLAHTATVGFAWSILQTLGSKFVAVFGQMVLAWLLDPKDFGVVSYAFAVGALVNIIQQGGQRELLIQRQARLDRWTNPAFWMALTLGLLALMGNAIAAPIAALVYRAPQVRGLLLILGLAALLNTVALVPTAILQAQLRFRFLAINTFVTAVLMSGLSVLFAFLGTGPYAFVLSWPIAAVFRLAWLWIAARPRIRPTPQFRRWRYMAGDGARVLLARACATLIMNGDYMILGLLQSQDVAGIYYFAFNLSWQVWLLLAYNLDGVLMPTLTRLKDDPIRQGQGFLAGARLLALLGIPVCLLQAGLADPGIRALFSATKWAPAIPVIQIVSVGMAFRMLAWPAFSLLQAQGRFATQLTLGAAGAVLFVALVTVAAATASPAFAPVAVGIAVSVYFTLEGPISLYVAIRPAGAGWAQVAAVYTRPLLFGSLAVIAGMAASHWLPADLPVRNWARLAGIFAIAAILYATLVRSLDPRDWTALTDRLKPLLSRRPAAAAQAQAAPGNG